MTRTPVPRARWSAAPWRWCADLVDLDLVRHEVTPSPGLLADDIDIDVLGGGSRRAVLNNMKGLGLPSRHLQRL